MATRTKCTKSLTGADRFLKSSISETINKIVVEIKKLTIVYQKTLINRNS